MRDIIKKLEELNIEKKVVKEDLADMAQQAEMDHEVQMARGDLYKAAKYAVSIHKMMKDISEMEGIDGWVASKITKAADYLGSVKHYMESQYVQDVELAVVPVAGDMTDAMTMPEESIEEVHEAKDCGPGMYYCKTDKKCKPIPKGMTVKKDGELVKEAEEKPDMGKLLTALKKKLKDEGGAAGMDPLKKIAKEMGIDLTPAMLSSMDGISKHKHGDYILEDFDSSHPDYQSHMQNETDKDEVMSIIKKHPEEAKKMMQAGDVFEIYGKDLYNKLFDYMANESGKYMGGSDIDPVNEINDMLDGFGLLDLPNDAIGYGEDVNEAPMNTNFMKQMSKMQGKQNTMSQQDMINSIISKLPRDNAEKGIDGAAKPQDMPMVKKPKINPVTRQKMVNKMAKDPYGADMTTGRKDGRLMQSKFENWGKK